MCRILTLKLVGGTAVTAGVVTKLELKTRGTHSARFQQETGRENICQIGGIQGMTAKKVLTKHKEKRRKGGSYVIKTENDSQKKRETMETDKAKHSSLMKLVSQRQPEQMAVGFLQAGAASL